MAAESWETFRQRCVDDVSTVSDSKLDVALAALSSHANLARTIVVWKHVRGAQRERLPLIQACARLGRHKVVLVLLLHNQCSRIREDVFLDAIRNDKATVVRAMLESSIFEPQKGFLGYALGECGAARSADCTSILIADERCKAQVLRQCDHHRFGLPAWSHIRVLEKAIERAAETGAEAGASASFSDHSCLKLLTIFAGPHLQDEEWQRILRLLIERGDEGPLCALLRVLPRLLVQAERMHFPASSQAAATQRKLGYAHYLGTPAQDEDVLSRSRDG